MARMLHDTLLAEPLVAQALAGRLDEAQARPLARRDPQLVALALARRIAARQTAAAGTRPTPSTPSGTIPVYAKANVPPPRGRRRKRPGAKNGHPGHHRATPTRIDQRQTRRLKVCPGCGGPLQRCQRTRTRLVEDLPENLQSIVTEHTIHRDYCPRCKKHVAPVVPDALPNATFGHRLVSFAAWCHYGLGVTLDQFSDLLQYHLRTTLSAGGPVAAWQRLAEVLTPWYEQLAEQAKRSAYLHAADVRRLLKRLRRTGDHLFTFLDYPQIPFENNFAERMIRPAVILRKNSPSNRSDRGARTQAVLMSVYRTLRRRGHDPLQTIADAVLTYLQTGQLPPLPAARTANG